ncbi:small-conductance mechanosensitive channel [Xenococcus sp. PCC 7305]|uniref:mechanosensitive ion channel family protein n=1 Tax=Xenococcus sp. PCC 7305 TaxID=102125 RepID=UPI0002AC4AD8|nr:mechanosensitive ion channel domain-containing protein [Xenococcus sp. PCC 7305]ELS03544.1 small-conductance mechanosensitive channel [Xenococcus sp. PCC 7305]
MHVLAKKLRLQISKFLKNLLLLFVTIFLLFINSHVTAQQLKELPSGEDLSSNIEDIIDTQNSESLINKQKELSNLGLFDETSGSLGNIIYSAVKIDGRIVFQVASSLAIYEASNDENIKINIRVRNIENTLTGIVKRNIEPSLLQVNPAVLNNEQVIKISKIDQTQEWILMTITSQDAQLYGMSIPELAKIRSIKVKDVLTKAWQERQKTFLIRQFFIGLGIVIAMFVASLLLIWLRKYLTPRKPESQSMLWNKNLIQVGHAVIWLPGTGWILQLFPYTRSWGVLLLQHSISISLTIIIFLLTSKVLDLFVKFSEASERIKTVPVRILVQVFYILLVVLCILFIVSDLLQQPLTNIMAGVGAGSAILMLVFKDSILGFIAGIQLTTNNMVALGDWIEMPKYGADGSVIEVSLITVKVQNWDKTITLIPTYALVSDSFKNWRTMPESGGRRIKRAVYIDLNSIKFCDQEMLNRFSKMNYVSDYIEKKYQELTEYNIKTDITNNAVLKKDKWITNIGIFRAYIVAYLQAHPQISDTLTFLVRQLQSTEHGLPIEIYVFSSDTRWVNYENIQADIFDHILSIVPEFELRVFQNVSGYDFQKFN